MRKRALKKKESSNVERERNKSSQMNYDSDVKEEEKGFMEMGGFLKKKKKDSKDKEKMEENDDEAPKISQRRRSGSGSGSTTGGSESDVTIIGLQKSNGTWSLDDLVSVLKCNQDLVESKNPSNDLTLWVTVIMLQYLEKKYSNTRNLWEMVAKKAIIFIKKTCKNVGMDHENLTQQAIQFIENDI